MDRGNSNNSTCQAPQNKHRIAEPHPSRNVHNTTERICRCRINDRLKVACENPSYADKLHWNTYAIWHKVYTIHRELLGRAHDELGSLCSSSICHQQRLDACGCKRYKQSTVVHLFCNQHRSIEQSYYRYKCLSCTKALRQPYA